MAHPQMHLLKNHPTGAYYHCGISEKKYPTGTHCGIILTAAMIINNHTINFNNVNYKI